MSFQSRGLQSTMDGEDASKRSLPSDFGIKVDFDDLEDDEREVSCASKHTSHQEVHDAV